MKQYLPLKPVKRGIKIWVVAESNSGYFLDLQVYVGKEGGGSEHGLGERVVLERTGEKHTVYSVIIIFRHQDCSRYSTNTCSTFVEQYGKIAGTFLLI